MRTRLAWLGLVAMSGCSGGSPSGVADAGPPDLGPTNPLVAARPYRFQVPFDYDPAKPTPLVILLHGFSADGFTQDAYFGLGKYLERKNVLYAFPDGTKNSSGQRFWNATDACCDFEHSGVDDVAYLDAIVDDVSRKYNVDRKRIYFTGHSNGGYMSHRMACERSGRIAAIVALAGDNWKDTTKCQPTDAVAVLQVHGDADMSVPYDGNDNSPSAHDSVLFWAKHDGCNLTPDTTAPPLDLDATAPGAETTIERYPGCKAGAAELWTLHGVGHLPNFKPTWAETIYGFMAAHPKP